MKQLLIPFCLCLIILIGVANGSTQEGYAAQSTLTRSIFVQSPREGQPLQGVEIIEGRIRGEDFISGKLSFRYADDGKQTWFYLADIDPSVDGGNVTSFRVEWDTTQITDGNYHLRLKAIFSDNVAISEEIRQLRVRNYSPIETNTPAPEGPENKQPFPTNTSAPALLSTSQPFESQNPASLEKSEMRYAVMIGLGITIALFLVGGIYSGIKRILH